MQRKRPGEKQDEHEHLTTRAQSQEGPSERRHDGVCAVWGILPGEALEGQAPEAFKVMLATQSTAEESRPKGAGLAEAVGSCFPSPALIPSHDAGLVPVYWSIH